VLLACYVQQYTARLFFILSIPVNVTADSGNMTSIPVNVTEDLCCAF